MKTIISEAIEKRKLLEFNYQGYYRVVEPHTFGVFGNGNELLIAYQVDGESSSRKVPFWSNFQVREINDISIMEDTFFEPREGYKRNDERFKLIYSQI
jgi:hypothetical protein